ncbi:MAG: polysaccharide deacetylase family protein, partial [Candidatus Eremiobacteraeota bacterium]|nr:polysaccharide deacetylase family protein [Candidatus Eremiobacteraeota bacterium]
SIGLILDLLEKYGARATFFFMGYWAKQKPGLVKKVMNCGHEIGCHGYYHHRVYEMGKVKFEEDLTMALSCLEELTGRKTNCYRAPEWSIRKCARWAFDILAKRGIKYDSSIMPTIYLGDPKACPLPYSIKTKYGEITEVPPTVIDTPIGRLPVSGGLFLRAFPYSIIKNRFLYLNQNDRPAVIYVHPWELIPDHPRLNPYSLRGFFHYTMLGKTKSRLDRLLSDFEFTGIEDYFEK